MGQHTGGSNLSETATREALLVLLAEGSVVMATLPTYNPDRGENDPFKRGCYGLRLNDNYASQLKIALFTLGTVVGGADHLRKEVCDLLSEEMVGVESHLRVLLTGRRDR